MKPHKSLEQLTAEAIQRGRLAISNGTATPDGRRAAQVKATRERGQATLAKIAKVFPPVKTMLASK